VNKEKKDDKLEKYSRGETEYPVKATAIKKNVQSYNLRVNRVWRKKAAKYTAGRVEYAYEPPQRTLP
jgi:hypothetical protein